MKKLIPVILMAAVLFSACETKTDTTINNQTFISGKFTNPKDTLVIFSMPGRQEKALVNAAGEFEIELNIESPTYLKFKHGPEHQSMYISPGDSIYITLDTDEFDESLSFSGRGADASNYLIHKFMFNEKLDMSNYDNYAVEKDIFIHFADSIEKLSQSFIDDEMKILQNLPEEFINAEKGTIKYELMLMRLNYPEIYSYYNKKEIDTSGYYSFIKELNFNDSNLISNDAYLNVLSQVIQMNVANTFRNDSTLVDIPNEQINQQFVAIDKLISNQALLNYFYFKTLNENLVYSGPDGMDVFVDKFKKICTDTASVRIISELYTKKLKLAKGQPAPVFNCVNIKGDSVSLSDFLGKAVYVDFWATWCSPCRGELPYLAQLIEDYKDKNIAFISLSVDDDRNAWQKMVSEKNLPGNQLIGEKGWSSAASREYMIYGVPTFVLIDKEGKIITVNAPRPSSDEVRTMIDAAL